MKARGLSPRSVMPWIALALSLMLTLIGWQAASLLNRERIIVQFNKIVEDVDFAIRHRLLEYEQTLRGGAGLFMASSEVTKNEWKAFVENIHLQKTYPGIQGMGFAKQTLPEERDALITAMRAAGHRDFTLHPSGERAMYYPIIYLEPLDWRNRRAIGYDMFAEPVRNAAMTKCRDEGLVTISGRVELVQETQEARQAGFLMYVPLYSRGAPLATVDERRAAFLGFVYSPFRMNDFMAGAFMGPDPWLRDNDLMELHIYDGSRADPSTFMFDSRPDTDHLRDSLYRRRTLRLYGHEWMMEATPTPEFYARYDLHHGDIVLGGGLLISLLVFMIAARLEWQKTGALERSGRMENALHETEERFDLAVRGANLGTWDWDLPSGHVEFSERALDMIGYRPGELKSHVSEWERLIHPEDYPRVKNQINAHLEGRAEVYESEYRMRSKQGEWVWILDIGKVVIRDAQGAPVRMAGASFNIDGRKRAAEALAESEKNYRTIADFTNDWETWLAPDGWLRYVSPSCERITGYPANRFRDDPGFMLSIIHPQDQAVYQRHLDECHTEHACCSGQDCGEESLKFRIIRKDGVQRWIEHICQSVSDSDGSWMGRRASNRDITEMVEAQEAMRRARVQAEEATRLKDNFVSLVAHDLRSPLTSITGLLKLALSESPILADKRLSQILTVSLQSGENMINIINDLLNISRLQTGSLIPHPAAVNLHALAAEALSSISHLAETKGLTLSNEVPADVTVHADLTLMGEALRNLVSNAIKFTPTGGVVTVGAEESNSHVTLSVRDTGVGVKPSIASSLFRHDVRTSTPGTVGERGTGLGLPYTYDIVKAHGGELSFESQPGAGSVFRIALPAGAD